MKRSTLLVILLSFAVAGCGLVGVTVSLDDARMKPMLEAMAKVDRQAFGFTEIRRDDDILLEFGPSHGYDAMLHISGKTSHTIAFKSVGPGYEWIGEQETFHGPGKYKTPDGEFYEEIILNYDKVPISGFPINQLSVDYVGDDPALAFPHHLSLADARPILVRWGY